MKGIIDGYPEIVYLLDGKQFIERNCTKIKEKFGSKTFNKYCYNTRLGAMSNKVEQRYVY